jgi:hypothetical protein
MKQKATPHNGKVKRRILPNRPVQITSTPTGQKTLADKILDIMEKQANKHAKKVKETEIESATERYDRAMKGI